MAKSGKKKAPKRNKPSKTKQTVKRKAKAKKAKKASSRGAGARAKATSPDHDHMFMELAGRSNQQNKPPICYHRLAGGSWMICFLQSDGSYAQCQPYSGPIHQPLCG